MSHASLVDFYIFSLRRQVQGSGGGDHQHHSPLGNRAQRRESFLYRLPSEEVLDQLKHHEQETGWGAVNLSVISEDDLFVREAEEQIVTPFAQILATLKDVRSNLATMVSMQRPTENSSSVSGSNRAFLDKFRLSS